MATSNQQRCPICLDLIKIAEDQVESFPCSHTFHAGCLVSWGDALGSSVYDHPCPVCKVVPREQAERDSQVMRQAPFSAKRLCKKGPAPALASVSDASASTSAAASASEATQVWDRTLIASRAVIELDQSPVDLEAVVPAAEVSAAPAAEVSAAPAAEVSEVVVPALASAPDASVGAPPAASAPDASDEAQTASLLPIEDIEDNEQMSDTAMETGPLLVAQPPLVVAPSGEGTPSVLVEEVETQTPALAPVVGTQPAVQELYEEYESPLPSLTSEVDSDSDDQPLVKSGGAQSSASGTQASAPDAHASSPDAQAAAPVAQATASVAQASESEAQALAPNAQALVPDAQATAPVAQAAAAVALPSVPDAQATAPVAQVTVDVALPPRAPSADAQLEAALASTTVTCAICFQNARRGSCRTLSEGRAGGTERLECNQCQRVSLALYRKFGSVNYFREMGDEPQKQLYLKCHSLKPRHMEGVAKSCITASTTTSTTFAEGGKFLPLSVWRKQGFNIAEENIRDEDKDKSDVFGEAVRLRIRSAVETKEVSVEETITMKSRRGLKRANSTSLPLEDQPTPMALQDLPETEEPEDNQSSESSSKSSSNSSDSDSDSSSSPGKKKKKKKKKNKKGTSNKKKKAAQKQKEKVLKKVEAEKKKKEEEKAEAQRARQAAIMASRMRGKMAARVDKLLPKLQAAIDVLTKSLSNHRVCMIPEITLKPIRNVFIAAEKLVHDLQAAVDGAPLPEESVPSMTKQVLKEAKNLDNMFNVFSRAP